MIPGLLVTDVDSTLVTGEGIDILAGLAGVGPQVADITHRAMLGEIDFRTALRQRVALLAGMPADACRHAYEQLVVSDGAPELIAAAHDAGWRVGVVSGGFHATVDLLARDLGISLVAANRLEVSNGLLTGRLVGTIVDAAGKATALRRFAAHLGAQRVVAVGDGANDVAMLAAADVGVAYRAKPALRRAADVVIDDLRDVIGLLAS